MKKLLIILLATVSLSFTAATNYCNGFEEGYKAGWCDDDYGCIEPIVPVCPVMRINDKDTYRDGYNRGFKMGIKAKENQ